MPLAKRTDNHILCDINIMAKPGLIFYMALSLAFTTDLPKNKNGDAQDTQ